MRTEGGRGRANKTKNGTSSKRVYQMFGLVCVREGEGEEMGEVVMMLAAGAPAGQEKAGESGRGPVCEAA